jgi:hypothetical protein
MSNSAWSAVRCQRKDREKAASTIAKDIIGRQLLDASAVYEAQRRGTSAAHGGVAAAHTIHSLHSRAARFTHQREYLVRLGGRLLRLQWHSLTRRGKSQGEGNCDQSDHLSLLGRSEKQLTNPN